MQLVKPCLTSALLIAVLLSACSMPMPTGDFGRAEHNILTDEVLPYVGAQAGINGGETVATLDLTPEEQELRSRAWRYVKAPHAQDWFTNFLVELKRNRFIKKEQDIYFGQLYFQFLRGERYRSSHTRFKRLESDIRTDQMLLKPFFNAACKVIQADQERERALRKMNAPSPDLILNAVARVDENKSVIVLVRRALEARVSAYHYALENLHVETPSNYAYPVAGEIKMLQDMMLYLDKSAKCTLPKDFSSAMNEIPSRMDPKRKDFSWSVQNLQPGQGEIPSRYSKKNYKKTESDTKSDTKSDASSNQTNSQSSASDLDGILK